MRKAFSSIPATVSAKIVLNMAKFFFEKFSNQGLGSMFSVPWNVDEFVRARSKNLMLFSRLIFIFQIRCAKRELVMTNEWNSEPKTWQREFLLFHFLCTGIENIKGGTFANIFDWIGALLSKLFRFVVGFANILKKIKTWRHFFPLLLSASNCMLHVGYNMAWKRLLWTGKTFPASNCSQYFFETLNKNK